MITCVICGGPRIVPTLTCGKSGCKKCCEDIPIPRDASEQFATSMANLSRCRDCGNVARRGKARCRFCQRVASGYRAVAFKGAVRGIVLSKPNLRFPHIAVGWSRD